MPRWRALPQELDPQLREFTGQLRRIVDRSGLSLSAVADRTGYSKTSWERYLNGRLLAPKGAIIALAEATGTDPFHLTAMWELAERAWSRAEPRQDGAVESPRIARARAALGEFGPPPEADALKPRTLRAEAPVRPGIAGRTGVSPSMPRESGGRAHGHRVWTFLAALVGVVVVAAGAFLLTDSGPSGSPAAAGTTRSPSPLASPSASLPPGVQCRDAGCNGKDAEAMGCSGDRVTTARSVTVRTTLVEVRYSRTCGAAWARITQAAPGDAVQVIVGTVRQRDAITTVGDTIAYTPMIAVRSPAEARACVRLASGQEGCTSSTEGG
ncbi:DUF2690 domain-containing protein [Streptomyces sp. NPDC018693]|uniref:helix-turn-helix domain-containing protein n=1 Tax=unclassified Streptomyces TaxID=2593676 RepID=UPI0037942B59